LRFVLLAALLGCARQPAPTPTEPEGVPGVTDPALAQILKAHWEKVMLTSPEWASSLGFPGGDDRLSDLSPAAAAESARTNRQAADAAKALTDLSAEDTVTKNLFVGWLEGELGAKSCRFSEWSVIPRSNPWVGFNSTLTVQLESDSPDLDAVNKRLLAFQSQITAHVEALKSGLSHGLVASVGSVQRTLKQLDMALDTTPEELPLGKLIVANGGERKDELLASLSNATDGLRLYRDLLKDTILPASRPDSQPGLSGMTIGESCYAGLIRKHTTLDLTADQIHELGLRELKGIHDEFRALGGSELGTEDLAEVFDKLRNSPELRYENAEAIVTTAEDSLARAQAAVPEWFANAPTDPCVVKEIPPDEAPWTTIAYYRQLAPDGSRPGAYFVNTYDPGSRPTFSAEALAFHESVPGHHLQIAWQYTLEDLPPFRRFVGVTSFVEGWALYSERLSDEMGLYTGPTDLFGMYAFDAWRAARLVVDTGIHHKGWSREQAEQFMRDNTPLALNNIENEVDRYIAWPGQALAYKTGQVVFRELRAKAETELGESFDRRRFHEHLLNAGSLSLPELRKRMDAWIASEKG